MSEISHEEFYSRLKLRDPNVRIAPVGESPFPHFGHDDFAPRESSPGARRYILKPFPSTEHAHDLPIPTKERPIPPLLAQTVKLNSTPSVDLRSEIQLIEDFIAENGGKS